MKKSRLLFVFLFLIMAVALSACKKETDPRSQLMDISRKSFHFDDDCTDGDAGYGKIINTGGSYIRYDYAKSDSNSESPYEIKKIQYIDSEIGSKKPYIISYPEHSAKADYGDEVNEALRNKLDRFLDKLDMDWDELDSFMLWYREFMEP